MMILVSSSDPSPLSLQIDLSGPASAEALRIAAHVLDILIPLRPVLGPITAEATDSMERRMKMVGVLAHSVLTSLSTSVQNELNERMRRRLEEGGEA